MDGLIYLRLKIKAAWIVTMYKTQAAGTSIMYNNTTFTLSSVLQYLLDTCFQRANHTVSAGNPSPSHLQRPQAPCF